jgi:hypothetical protein
MRRITLDMDTSPVIGYKENTPYFTGDGKGRIL